MIGEDSDPARLPTSTAARLLPHLLRLSGIVERAESWITFAVFSGSVVKCVQNRCFARACVCVHSCICVCVRVFLSLPHPCFLRYVTGAGRTEGERVRLRDLAWLGLSSFLHVRFQQLSALVSEYSRVLSEFYTGTVKGACVRA